MTTSPSTPAHSYIDTPEALDALCQQLAGVPYLVLDTEFLRERTYRPELCLVQLKYQDTLACIDTIAIYARSLAPLQALLLDPAITKVFHAASQDLEIFYLMTRQVPTPLFDTQVAAPLLGYNEQIGYGNLVKEHLGIELSKAQTRADWTRRPLTEQQIAYALDDVIYLEKLYLDIRDKLGELGRLDWLQPEFEALAAVEKYDQPAGDRWKKMRNIQRYKGAALSVIQALAEWREIKARELNRPRNWLLKDDVLCAIAQQQPDSDTELSHIRGLDRKSRERFGAEIITLVADASQRPPEPLPPFVKKQKLTAQTKAVVQLLNAWVHQRAAELDIHPNLLVPEKTLEKMVTGAGRAELSGWRDGLVGDQLDDILSGRRGLQCRKNEIVLFKDVNS